MSPLQKKAHLFANEQFVIQVDYGAEIVKWDLTPGLLAQVQSNNLIRSSTLIARPIEDMTDEEWRNIVGYSKSGLKEAIQKDDLKFHIARYLLSIGVYPFYQSHFDDGTVIDSREV